MFKVEELIKSKRFPKWVITHPIFKEVTTIDKIFPRIGLPNCEQEIELDNAKPAYDAAEALVKSIRAKFNKPTIKDKNIAYLLSATRDCLKKRKHCIRENGGKYTLNLPENICLEGQDKPVFREGESLFRVYNKLSDMLVKAGELPLGKLENTTAFKRFSTENIPNNKFKIVFSSDGIDGALDIGTMSSRGIRSCQSWDTGEYKHCTIGSIIDPFVGIIYLTSGSKYNDYGSKMMRRCIVRFIVDKKTHKPLIMLDNMYPEQDKKVSSMFVKFLSEKLGKKIDVQYGVPFGKVHNYHIPFTEVRAKLAHTSREGEKLPTPDDCYGAIVSYQDTIIQDSYSRKQRLDDLYKQHVHSKENKFKQNFPVMFKKAVDDLDKNSFEQEKTKALHLKLSGKDYHYRNALYGIANVFSNEIIGNEFISRNNFTNSNTYMRALYYNYFINKTKLMKNIKAKSITSINGFLGLNKNDKITLAVLTPILDSVLPSIDAHMKNSLKTLIEKIIEKKSSKPLSLPEKS